VTHPILQRRAQGGHLLREKIRARLKDIETEKGVRVLYACESGSRAWGFPSVDSDYDVRFVYLHPRDWYLSINLEHKRDVIERPVGHQLDISGWDLRKALQLLRKCNPPLMEWLGSPIVYWDEFTIAARMRELMSKYFSPVACLYHYLHMAQGNYRDYLKGPEVWIKKYFYILRPILAINWIERGFGVAPTEFQVLVEQVVDTPKLKEEIGKLIEAKRRGEELDRGPRIAPISEFIEGELARLENKRFEREYHRPTAPVDEFNGLFRSALDEVWLSL
jgi:predicted nucleotidyltransferase